ncbi:MAG: hypothetical protein OEY67_00850 [Gammaproteobacteria bacterium]|nr:hypothetical protein [Gammaproteobacteria bacterium]
MRTASIFLFIFLFSVFPVNAQEEDGQSLTRPLLLQSYEPNTVGFTWDDNDVRYLDFKLSQMYPISHNGKFKTREEQGYRTYPYFTFTGRFGMYLDKRDSSPVIGKRFNPTLIFRRWLGSRENYLDVGYAHESNGQRINTLQSFQQLSSEFAANGENPEFARDYISRGWDYWELSWRYSRDGDNEKLSTYLKLKYFLNKGFLQGISEEYNEWENDTDGKKRKYVDGVTLLAKKVWDYDYRLLGKVKSAVEYTTGYKDVAEYNTYRLELTFAFRNIMGLHNLPIMVWGSRGYNSDLVDYYKDVNSWGISLEMRNYLDQI